MKRTARVISFLFHPLIMPTLGLLLILNSGTYLSLLDPAAKRAILFVMALGTFIFPLMMIPVLYYRKLVTSLRDSSRDEKLAPYLIILVLYVITFVYFIRLPLSRIIQGYVLSVTILLMIILLLNLKFRISDHMAALGGMVGLIIALMLLFGIPLQGYLMIVLIAAGATGSARIAEEVHKPVEVYTGFGVGFGIVLTTLLVY